MAAIVRGAPPKITYAKAGGPPDDWSRLQVRDLQTGALLDDVVEVDATEGWAVVYELPLRVDPRNDAIVTKLITGRFAIERQERR